MPPSYQALVLLACRPVELYPSAMAVLRACVYCRSRLPIAAPRSAALYLCAYLGPFFEKAFGKRDALDVTRNAGLARREQ